MDELPNDVLSFVAGYLPPLESIRLNNTCKKIYSKLSLTATSPRQILTKFVRENCDDDAHYGFQVPVPPRVTSHSILLSLLWRDQGQNLGCEERKGRLYLVAEDKYLQGQTAQRSGGGRVVCVSDVAPHEERRIHFAFQPKKHETYHLSYVVGGASWRVHPDGMTVTARHELRLSDVTVQALVYDNRSRCFGNADNFLTKTNALCAWDRARLVADVDIEQVYLARGQSVPPLISFTCGTKDTKSNLQQELMEFMELMGFLRSAWDNWLRECSSYDNSCCLDDDLFKFSDGVHWLDDEFDFFDFDNDGDLILSPREVPAYMSV